MEVEGNGTSYILLGSHRPDLLELFRIPGLSRRFFQQSCGRLVLVCRPSWRLSMTFSLMSLGLVVPSNSTYPPSRNMQYQTLSPRILIIITKRKKKRIHSGPSKTQQPLELSYSLDPTKQRHSSSLLVALATSTLLPTSMLFNNYKFILLLTSWKRRVFHFPKCNLSSGLNIT